MITYEQFLEDYKNGKIGEGLAYFLSTLDEIAEKQPDKALGDELREYSDALYTLLKKDTDEEERKKAFEKFAGFKDFLERSEPGQKSNYTRITTVLKLDEVMYLNGIITEADKIMNFGIDVESYERGPEFVAEEEEPEAEAPAAEPLAKDELTAFEGSRSASAYIQNIRDNGFPQRNAANLSDEEKERCIDRFIKIMAARELADSDRGKKEKLVATQLSEEQIEQRAAQMKSDFTFQQYIRTLKDDPARMNAAISAATAKPGHGGGLDDMFKDYVKNQPPGLMRNDEILKRYMPTVKERIEILKEKYKTRVSAEKDLESVKRSLRGTKNERTVLKLQAKEEKLTDTAEDNDPKVIAAEIIVLRNMIHADKGKKTSLDKPIPVVKEDTLSYTAQDLRNSEESGQVLEDQSVRSLITTGHGGQMAAKARELANNKQGLKKELLDVYNENTIETRMSKMKRDAAALKDELDEARRSGVDLNKTMRKCKELLAEGMLLDMKIRDRQTGLIKNDELKKDVPWGEVNKLKQPGPENDRNLQTLLGTISPDDMFDRLGSIAQNGPRGLSVAMANRQNAQKPRIVEDEPDDLTMADREKFRIGQDEDMKDVTMPKLN